MLDAQKLAERLRECASGKLSLAEFEDWFVLRSWDIHRQQDQSLIDWVFEIEALFSAHHDQQLSTGDLSQQFGELAKTIHRSLSTSHWVEWSESNGIHLQIETASDTVIWEKLGADRGPYVPSSAIVPVELHAQLA